MPPAAPWSGISALDGVELMNVCSQLSPGASLLYLPGFIISSKKGVKLRMLFPTKLQSGIISEIRTKGSKRHTNASLTVQKVLP